MQNEAKTTKVKILKSVLERQGWAKFGACKGLPDGIEDGVTTISKENIILNLKIQSREELDEPVVINKTIASDKLYIPPALRKGTISLEEKYTPLHLREKIKEGYDVRLDNLSQDCTYDELNLFVRSFGNVLRFTLPQNKKTGQTIGFAYITYQKEEDALFAISKLNGYGWQNCILRARMKMGEF